MGCHMAGHMIQCGRHPIALWVQRIAGGCLRAQKGLQRLGKLSETLKHPVQGVHCSIHLSAVHLYCNTCCVRMQICVIDNSMYSYKGSRA